MAVLPQPSQANSAYLLLRRMLMPVKKSTLRLLKKSAPRGSARPRHTRAGLVRGASERPAGSPAGPSGSPVRPPLAPGGAGGRFSSRSRRCLRRCRRGPARPARLSEQLHRSLGVDGDRVEEHLDRHLGQAPVAGPSQPVPVHLLIELRLDPAPELQVRFSPRPGKGTRGRGRCSGGSIAIVQTRPRPSSSATGTGRPAQPAASQEKPSFPRFRPADSF